MKHEVKVTIILLLMFLTTQLIGLYVIDAYTPKIENVVINGTETSVMTVQEIPYGMQPPEVKPELSWTILLNIVVAIIIALGVFFLLTKLGANLALKIWFVLVIFLVLRVSLFAIINKNFPYVDAALLATLIAIPLTFFKAVRPNLIVHNLTELLVYPGLAAVFVGWINMNVWIIISLLILISIYDMWAVWKSTLMVNMAKYQIRTMKIFTGFFVPYVPKGVKMIKTPSRNLRKGKMKRMKIAVAILGGGDVAFPLIFAGVLYRASGLIPALMIVAGSTIALGLLFLYSKKGKFYPAMPFITAGCLLAWLISLLV